MAATTVDASKHIESLQEASKRFIVLMAPMDAEGLATWLFAACLTHMRRYAESALVVFKDDLYDETEYRRFYLAGCTILPAPKRISNLEQWHTCINSNEQHTSSYRGEAEAFCDSAAAAYQLLVSTERLWRPQEVRVLLAGFKVGQHRRAMDDILMNRLGGYRQAQITLSRCADEINPIDGGIIRGLLKGHTQERIAQDLCYTRESINRRLQSVYNAIVMWLNYGKRDRAYVELQSENTAIYY